MNNSLYTLSGLKRLATIVRQARKPSKSFREFELITGISHSTLRRIEMEEVQNPDDFTLAAIAPTTPYSFEELKAIAQERQYIPNIAQVKTAEDLLPIAMQLSDAELGRLGIMIVSHLAKIGYE